MFCEKCGKKKNENDKFCADCGASFGAIEQSANQAESVSRVTDAQYNSIGGWLYLVGISLFVTPFILGYSIIDSFTLVTDISMVEIESMAPGLAANLWFEIVMDSVFLLFVIYLLFLFKDLSSKFPKYFIWYLAASVAYLVIDLIIFSSITTSNNEMSNSFNEIMGEQVASIIRTMIGSTIWIAYALKSKRVKGTFVN
jgi:hypothetical protein